jgi:hypothetical protein
MLIRYQPFRLDTVQYTTGISYYFYRMQAIRNDLLRQRQVSPSTSPLENKYLAGFMRHRISHNRMLKQSKLWMRIPFLSIPPLNRQRIVYRLKNKVKGQVMLQGMAAACLHSMDTLLLIFQIMHT